MYAAFLERLPGPLAAGYGRGSRAAVALTRALLGRVAARPTGGWALRRGMLVHGVTDPIAAVEALRDFSLKERAGLIQCPTWVCSAEGDDISASAVDLVAALTCDKTYVRFSAAEGAGDHCEVGAGTLYHARSFGWLDGILRPDRVA